MSIQRYNITFEPDFDPLDPESGNVSSKIDSIFYERIKAVFKCDKMVAAIHYAEVNNFDYGIPASGIGFIDTDEGGAEAVRKIPGVSAVKIGMSPRDFKQDVPASVLVPGVS